MRAIRSEIAPFPYLDTIYEQLETTQKNPQSTHTRGLEQNHKNGFFNDEKCDKILEV